MQANQAPVMWTVVICAIVMLVVGMFGASSINSNLKLIGEKVDGIDVDVDESAISNAILAGIDIPEFPDIADIDNEKLDRVCELTPGCEFYEIDSQVNGPETKFRIDGMAGWSVYNTYFVDDSADSDFDEAMEKLLDLEDDEFTIDNIEFKDVQVRAYSDDDEEDGNYEVKVFARVTYTDEDEDHNDHVYIVVTSELDEGEYDELTVEEVTRSFEF